jgi:hypothetical protein
MNKPGTAAMICDLVDLRRIFAGANTATKQMKLNRAAAPYSMNFLIIC